MKLIVITPEKLLSNEAIAIKTVLHYGTDYLHLRKPMATESELAELLQTIPVELHNRIALHDHHQLIEYFPFIGGVHLNRRHPEAPPSFKGRISRSCHSLHELGEAKQELAYSFLSPIFDSISKQGYTASFLPTELIDAQKRGIINSSTVALGGVTPERIDSLKNWGFGGIALLGYVWDNATIEDIKKRLQIVSSAME